MRRESSAWKGMCGRAHSLARTTITGRRRPPERAPFRGPVRAERPVREAPWSKAGVRRGNCLDGACAARRRRLGHASSQEQRNQRYHQGDDEENLGKSCGFSGDSAETKDRSNERDNEKNGSPAEHGCFPFVGARDDRA